MSTPPFLSAFTDPYPVRAPTVGRVFVSAECSYFIVAPGDGLKMPLPGDDAPDAVNMTVIARGKSPTGRVTMTRQVRRFIPLTLPVAAYLYAKMTEATDAASTGKMPEPRWLAFGARIDKIFAALRWARTYTEAQINEAFEVATAVPQHVLAWDPFAGGQVAKIPMKREPDSDGSPSADTTGDLFA